MNRIITVLILWLVSLQGFSQTEFNACLFDASRNRVIPITVNQPQKVNSKTKVIVFSHGYDGNKKTCNLFIFGRVKDNPAFEDVKKDIIQ